MISINSTATSEKNKTELQPVYLYIVHDYDGNSNNLYFAEWDADIVFDGITYAKKPITHEQIGENSGGEIDAVRVKIGNVDRVIQAYFETPYDWRRKKVTIRMVFANQLADTSAKIDFPYYIDSYTAAQDVVVFNLTTKMDLMDAMLPGAMVSRTRCRWIDFKGTECGYSGGETTCNRTKQRCKELSNFSRYGGFPSINSHKVFV